MPVSGGPAERTVHAHGCTDEISRPGNSGGAGTLLAFIVVGGFAARAAVALASENLLWPDEIFQYLEQGHRAVFGYGYVPWEFRYAARSWLLPGFIAFWLWLCQAAQLDAPTFYVPFIKLVFCALSTTLICSAYRLARNLAGESAGLLAALLVAFWYELIYFAHKPLTEVVATYALVASLAFASESRPTVSQACCAGVLASLVASLRIQYAPVVALLGLYCVRRWRGTALAGAAAAGALAVLLAGALDRATWGGWFETYAVDYRLHAVRYVSEWFGDEPGLWYVGALTVASAGLVWVPLSLGWIGRLSASRLPLVCAATIVLTHSLIPHKEYRYIVAVVPLAWVTAALLFERARGARVLGRGGAGALLAVFFGVSALGLTSRLPRQDWVYDAGPLLARSPALDAYLWLSTASGVEAVLANEEPGLQLPFVGTGGYYYLHRDVPVYFPSELRAAGVSRSELSGSVTHWLLPADEPPVAGFTTVAAFGNLAIRRRTSMAGAWQRLCLPPAPTEVLIDEALSGLTVHAARDTGCR